MDTKLLGWARAVKTRLGWRRRSIPPLWIFTDNDRLPNPSAILAQLPAGLCGVVLRAGRGIEPATAVAIARICRVKRFALVVAGDDRLAARLKAGRHLSGGGPHRLRNLAPRGCLLTAPAHSVPERLQARRRGVDAVFLSPVFPTASHPGAPALGAVRWAATARRLPMAVLALGGIDGASVRGLPRGCCGVGVVGAASSLAFAQAAR